MTSALKSLREIGVPVSTVLDVGAQVETPQLQEVFPDKPHHLFEPNESLLCGLGANYREYEHHVHHLALSDTTGQAWQVMTALTGDEATHSRMSPEFVDPTENEGVVDCKPVQVTTLDSLAGKIGKPPFLLKVDVDGHEIPILRGARETLKDTNIVVIEAPLPNLLERAQFLVDAGFVLFDIVDPSYYCQTLAQVDLVFVRANIVEELDGLRPWNTRDFDWSNWQVYTV